MHTDAGLFFLVNPDAKEGKDFNADHLAGLCTRRCSRIGGLLKTTTTG